MLLLIVVLVTRLVVQTGSVNGSVAVQPNGAFNDDADAHQPTPLMRRSSSHMRRSQQMRNLNLAADAAVAQQPGGEVTIRGVVGLVLAPLTTAAAPLPLTTMAAPLPLTTGAPAASVTTAAPPGAAGAGAGASATTTTTTPGEAATSSTTTTGAATVVVIENGAPASEGSTDEAGDANPFIVVIFLGILCAAAVAAAFIIYKSMLRSRGGAPLTLDYNTMSQALTGGGDGNADASGDGPAVSRTGSRTKTEKIKTEKEGAKSSAMTKTRSNPRSASPRGRGDDERSASGPKSVTIPYGASVKAPRSQ